MATAWIFIDEQGDAVFADHAPKYFGLSAVTTTDPAYLCWQAEILRHKLWNHDHISRGYFHCTYDCSPIRQEVFGLFESMRLERIDVVAVTKDKVHQPLRHPALLYRTVAGLLARYISPRLAAFDELVVVAARWQAARDIEGRIAEAFAYAPSGGPPPWRGKLRVHVLEASAHPGIQIADYAAWASHRRRSRMQGYWWSKVERADCEVTDFLPF